MLRKLLIMVLTMCPVVGATQSKTGTTFSGSNNKDVSVCAASAGNFLTEQQVEDLISQLLKTIGTKNRYNVVNCTQVENCQAILFNGKPYILYNPNFLGRVKSLKFSSATLPEFENKDWETLTILAHELGHHVNNHLSNPHPDATQRGMELEADETAGFIIYLVGGSLEQAQFAYLDKTFSEEGNYSHPPRKQRLAAVRKGYFEAKGLYPREATVQQPTTVTTNYAGYIKLGDENLDLANYKMAQLYFSRAVELEPQNPEPYTKRAIATNRLLDSIAAYQDCEKAIKLNQLDAESYSTRAFIKFLNNNLIGGLEDCDFAIRLDPNCYTAYRTRGAIYMDQKKNTQALDDFNKAIKLNPQYHLAYNSRAILYKDALSKKEEAIADFTKAIEINPKFVLALRNRGNLQHALNNSTAALLDLTRAIELNPTYMEALWSRANVKKALGDYTGSLEDLTKAIEVTKENPAPLYNSRALVKKELKDFEGALTDYQKAIDLRPAAAYFHNRGMLFMERNNNQSALTDINKAIELAPMVADYYITRGQLKRKTNDLDAALLDLNQSIKIYPLPRGFRERGELKKQLNDKEGALNDHLKVTEMESLNPENFKTLAMTRAFFMDYSGALLDCTKAIELSRNGSTYYCARADIYEKMNQDKAALKDYDFAIDIDKKNAIALNNRGLLHRKMKSFDKGCLDFSKAAELGDVTAKQNLETHCNYKRWQNPIFQPNQQAQKFKQYP